MTGHDSWHLATLVGITTYRSFPSWSLTVIECRRRPSPMAHGRETLAVASPRRRGRRRPCPRSRRPPAHPWKTSARVACTPAAAVSSVPRPVRRPPRSQRETSRAGDPWHRRSRGVRAVPGLLRRADDSRARPPRRSLARWPDTGARDIGAGSLAATARGSGSCWASPAMRTYSPGLRALPGDPGSRKTLAQVPQARSLMATGSGREGSAVTVTAPDAHVHASSRDGPGRSCFAAPLQFHGSCVVFRGQGVEGRVVQGTQRAGDGVPSSSERSHPTVRQAPAPGIRPRPARIW